MGPGKSKQSQTRDWCRIFGLQKHHLGGYTILEVTKGSKLGNFTFTIKLRSELGDPNNLVWIERKTGPQGRNYFINGRKSPNPGFWVFTDFRSLIGQPHDGWGHAGIILNILCISLTRLCLKVLTQCLTGEWLSVAGPGSPGCGWMVPPDSAFHQPGLAQLRCPAKPSQAELSKAEQS